jgi:uncharacterized protein
MPDPRNCSADRFVELLLAALPPEAAEARLLEVRLGPFWTVVHTSLGAGMASTMVRESEPGSARPVAWAGTLHERRPLELAGLLRSASPAEAAIGLAAVNALLPRPRGMVADENAESILAERGRGRRVAMIGRFPFAERLRTHCRTLWVFELSSHRRPEDFSEAHSAALLPEAEVVAISGTTLVNRTLSGILAQLRPDAFRMLLGPSTPLCPALLEHGLDVLGGSLVVDPGSVLRAACEGAVTPQIPGVRRVALWREGARDR